MLKPESTPSLCPTYTAATHVSMDSKCFQRLQYFQNSAARLLTYTMGSAHHAPSTSASLVKCSVQHYVVLLLTLRVIHIQHCSFKEITPPNPEPYAPSYCTLSDPLVLISLWSLAPGPSSWPGIPSINLFVTDLFPW